MPLNNAVIVDCST